MMQKTRKKTKTGAALRGGVHVFDTQSALTGLSLHYKQRSFFKSTYVYFIQFFTSSFELEEGYTKRQTTMRRYGERNGRTEETNNVRFEPATKQKLINSTA